MPTLFMIVGRGIGLHLTLTDAPLHVLVRYTHPGLPTLNVEATSGGGFARDLWYRQQLSTSDKANMASKRRRSSVRGSIRFPSLVSFRSCVAKSIVRVDRESASGLSDIETPPRQLPKCYSEEVKSAYFGGGRLAQTN